MRIFLVISFLSLWVVASIFSCKAQPDLPVKPFENNYFYFEYPEGWTITTAGENVKIDIPDPSNRFASIVFAVTRMEMVSSCANSTWKVGLEALFIEKFDDSYVSQKEYSTIELGGKEGCYVKTIGTDETKMTYNFAMPKKHLTIDVKVRVGNKSFSKFEHAINKVLESFQFKEISDTAPLRVVIEVTEQEFTKDWVEQTVTCPKLGPLLIEHFF